MLGDRIKVILTGSDRTAAVVESARSLQGTAHRNDAVVATGGGEIAAASSGRDSSGDRCETQRPRARVGEDHWGIAEDGWFGRGHAAIDGGAVVGGGLIGDQRRPQAGVSYS